jgi:hypothetical protein
MPQKTNKTLDSYPDLVKDWHPYKNGDKQPEDFAQFSNKKVWWNCDKGPDHEYERAISTRTKQRAGCPFCANSKISITNRFDLNQESLMKEWNYEKNIVLPSEVTIGTNKKIWWICINGHEWEAKLADRVQRGFGCKACTKLNKVDYTPGDWIIGNTNLLQEWNYKKNEDIGNPEDFKSNSNKKVWWKCDKGPDHEWEASLRKRALSNTGCPCCKGKKISVTNSLISNYPDIAKQFHREKNKDIDINNIFMNSNKKVWWKCDKGPDHEWETKVYARTYRNRHCPFCSGHNFSTTNNLLIVAPQIAKQFDLEKNFPKTPSDFASGSNTTVWWKCDNQDHRGWKAPIAARMRQAIGCYICNQEKRFASESRLFDIVKELFPNYIIERAIRPDFLEGLEIDIYVPQLKLAIEYQGIQHYEVVEFWGGEEALKKRKANDTKKRKLLKLNNIVLLEWKYTIEINKKRVLSEINKIGLTNN